MQTFKNALSVLFVYMISTTIVIAQGDALPGGSTASTTDPVEDICGNTQYLTIKGRLMENYDSSDEFYRLLPIAKVNSLERFSRNNTSAYIQGSTQECASLQVRANSQGGVTCPGRYELNRDVNRVPCVMREFKCLCTNCRIPHSIQSRRMANRCEPIFHYFPVMRRTIRLEDDGDTWSYVLEPLAVGCTCASRRQLHSSRH